MVKVGGLQTKKKTFKTKLEREVLIEYFANPIEYFFFLLNLNLA